MIQLHGHTYPESIYKKYLYGIAWLCSVETCKRIHRSKHDKCKECRAELCTKCKRRKIIIPKKVCSYCE